jgi:hypothetical protein
MAQLRLSAIVKQPDDHFRRPAHQAAKRATSEDGILDLTRL